MRTEKQIENLNKSRSKAHISNTGRKVSLETKKKIGDALRKSIGFECVYCKKNSMIKPSHFARKKRHFCSRSCYADYRKYLMKPEEQNSYKNGGIPIFEKEKRIKARSTLNHAIRDGKLKRQPCARCKDVNSQAHHENYDFPLKVIWLCFKCHRIKHKVHQNPELVPILTGKKAVAG